MRKSTKAFQLQAMTEPVTFVIQPRTKKLFPVDDPEAKEHFIYGEGHKKTAKWKRITIDPLSDPFTAEEIAAVADEHGWPAPLGMVQGWGRYCLANGQSCGLSYHKHEVFTMAKYGKVYDEFTDKVQAIGDKFVASLLSKGFRMEGKILWYDDRIIGSTDRFRLHPIQYIDHCLMGMLWTPPMFNPMELDDLMVKLFIGKYGTGKVYERNIDKIVSVKDRIASLTTKTIAKEIESIYELQKIFIG